MAVSNLRILTLNGAHGRGLSYWQGFDCAEGIQRKFGMFAYLLCRISMRTAVTEENDKNSNWNRRVHPQECHKEAADSSDGQMGAFYFCSTDLLCASLFCLTRLCQ